MPQKQSADPQRELLRERVLLGINLSAPLPLPPNQSLAVLGELWKEVRKTERRRTELILLGWFAAALLQTTACASCLRSYAPASLEGLLYFFGFCAFFTAPIPVYLLRKRRSNRERCLNVIQQAANQASSGDCVGPLLDLLEDRRLTYKEFSLLHALKRLLPRLTTDEARALTAAQRATLARILPHRKTYKELVISGLLVLGEAQDASLQEFAQKLSQTSSDERQREAADDYLALTKDATQPIP